MIKKSLNLFKWEKDGGKKGPGMIDQFDMFKNSQDAMSKINDLDKDIHNIETIGLAS